MLRTADVYAAIVDVLIQGKREWTIAQLHRELLLNVFGLDVGEYHVRRAVKLLPEKCIERKGRRMFIAARDFAPTPELVATIRRLDAGLNIPLQLNERRRQELRRALVLTNDWALHQSLRWAEARRAVEYEAAYYTMFVRARCA